MSDSPMTRRLLVGGGLATAGAAFLGTSTANAAALTSAQLTTKLKSYQASRGGTFSVALYDRRNHTTFSYQSTWRNETLSIVKVLIMATVLRRCQERRVNLTSTQVSQAYAMMTRSDNTAANALLTWAGVSNVRRVAALYGMTSTVIQGGTTAGASNWWGYSTTTARDQIVLMTGIIWGTTVISVANRDYLKRLMAQVISSQRWGVCAPPLPTSNAWNTKNGWGPRTGGYRLNSVGHIYGNARNYNAVILSRAPQGFYYGRDTVNGVSKILYSAMAEPLR
ncbi:MAG TPA: serine hydrolase [Flexivirga sp.]|uniref:serine hydrolase n=1 Tax=Flexivirga sp. TaxID=1962927 RepID=UPI002B71AFC2|nr:serine hydrolase [Flexivirga sp.]HWC24088.1 serine hydrolase [Flexivirga sp.]